MEEPARLAREEAERKRQAEREGQMKQLRPGSSPQGRGSRPSKRRASSARVSVAG